MTLVSKLPIAASHCLNRGSQVAVVRIHTGTCDEGRGCRCPETDLVCLGACARKALAAGAAKGKASKADRANADDKAKTLSQVNARYRDTLNSGKKIQTRVNQGEF